MHNYRGGVFDVWLRWATNVDHFMYRIAGNVCGGNYVLRFVVNNVVCRFNVCGFTGHNVC